MNYNISYMPEENKKIINEIIKEVLSIEKQAINENKKHSHTHRRGKVLSVIEQYFKKLSEKK
tara:strand:+ start:92 stop:277 length:186 start_codon:yes stop_codon:yes gene_type:complete